MNKKFLVLLPFLAFGVLTACGKKANDGKSAETAYTVEEMINVMANYEGGQISTEEYYVTSTIAAGSTYSSQYGSWTAYDVDHNAESEKPFQFYSCQMDEAITKNYKGNGCLDGAKIIVKGYAQLYHPNEGADVYEICYLSSSKSPTGQATSPLIVSVEGGKEYVQPDATAIAIGQDFSLEEEQTKTLKPTFTPADGKHADIVWTSSVEAVATVNAGVVTAVAAGTSVITATAGTLTASVTVTVTAKPAVVTELVLSVDSLGLVNAGGYGANNGEHTVGEVVFVTNAMMDSGTKGMQLQKANATLLNKNALPKAISSIEIKYNQCGYSDNNVTFEFAAATFDGATPATAADTKTLVTVKDTLEYTITPAANTYTFFKLSNPTGGAHYIDSITINYVVAE